MRKYHIFLLTLKLFFLLELYTYIFLLKECCCISIEECCLQCLAAWILVLITMLWWSRLDNGPAPSLRFQFPQSEGQIPMATMSTGSPTYPMFPLWGVSSTWSPPLPCVCERRMGICQAKTSCLKTVFYCVSITCLLSLKHSLCFPSLRKCFCSFNFTRLGLSQWLLFVGW